MGFDDGHRTTGCWRLPAVPTSGLSRSDRRSIADGGAARGPYGRGVGRYLLDKAARSGTPARSVATTLPLYTTGTQWGPYSDLNPFKNWDYVTGTVGLVYETPFRYDPLKNEFIPWLAESGEWQGEDTYAMTVRDGVTWSDGEPFAAEDVKFTIDLLKIETHPQHTLWTTGLKDVTTSGNTVTFTFEGTPNYQEFDFYLYNVPIVPQHIWKNYSEDDVVSGNVNDTKKLVGTGPYTYGGGLDDPDLHLDAARGLVGHGGPGAQRGAAEDRRRLQRQQRGVAGQPRSPATWT
jgi:peptide/nickel transport system substrate-binding protein